MADRITVTGYGRTEAEAKANAQSKINDIRMIDDSAMIAFGAMGFFLRVITGYLQLAWVMVLSLSVRPISTLLAGGSIALGCTVGWMLLSLIFATANPEPEPPNAFKDFMNVVLWIILGSGIAAGIAPHFLSFTALFEKTEISLLRRLPFWLRSPLLVTTNCWPILLPFIVVGFAKDWSFTKMVNYVSTWTTEDFVIWGLVVVGLQGLVIAGRVNVSLAAQEFNWYGAPLEPQAETVMGSSVEGSIGSSS